MSDNFDETYDNDNIIDSQNKDFPLDLIKEILQELYINLVNTDVEEYYNFEEKLNEFMNNFLFEYDLDPKKLFHIMTSNSQNILDYSSLIGFLYQHGIGCEVDNIKAFEIFSNAVNNKELNQFSSDEADLYNDDNAKLNEIVSQYFYSLFLYKDIISNRKDGYKSRIKNAERGDLVSQYYIGNCYYHGESIQRNYSKAVEWYSKSSEGGNIKAICGLAVCYQNGKGIAKNERKAFELILKSAKGGYKFALYMVGYCYQYGVGILKDESKAFEWYLKAAKKGDVCCQYLVANYYYDGRYISKNKEREFYWNRKAAMNGYIDAQYKLANYYLSDPINKNERNAFKWYSKIANKNSQRAVYLVAKCYRNGVGTDKNLDEATEWFQKYKNYESDSYIKTSMTLNDFLNGSNINVSEIPI